MTQTQEKTKLRPLGNRALVQRQEGEEMAKGGILLPESARKKQETAVVVAVGEGKKDKEGNLFPVPVKEGDTILLDKYSGQEVTIDDVEYVIVRGEDIVAIIE